MFRRRLKALEYQHWDNISGSDPLQLRSLVLWLEDQKIRHYKVEDRTFLRDVQSDMWPQAFDQYCKDVGCPIVTTMPDKVEWLVGVAIKYEFDDNQKMYQNVMIDSENKKTEIAAPTVKSTNPLDNLDFDSKEFKEGVRAVASLLRVPEHPDHLITLEACSKVVRKRLCPTVLKDPGAFIPKGKPFPVLDFKCGPDLGDVGLNNAFKILNLLYNHDLRDLQTKINEAIVCVQNITANPKTDTKLGRVGF